MWCVVANVRPEAWGNATSPGTKHFRAGAIVWITRLRWDRLDVIGRHRVSKRFITVIEETARLTNWRVKEAFHPTLLALLRREDHTWTQAECEAAAANLAKQHPSVVDLAG